VFSPAPLRFALAGIAAVVVALGAYAIGHSNAKSTSGTATAAQSAPAAAPATATGRTPSTGGQVPPTGGAVPQNGTGAPQGFGTPVTGAAAAKAKAAALTKYKGTVERVMKLQDGSYEVHLISANGEYHVAVSKTFEVTGANQGGPGGGAGGPPPSSGTQGSSGTTS
jgi:hypothetical protein